MCTIVLYKPHHCSTDVKLSWRRNIHKKCVTFRTARRLMNRVGLLVQCNHCDVCSAVPSLSLI